MVYLNLDAATVPRAVANNVVANIPIIKLFLVLQASIYYSQTVVSPGLHDTNHLSYTILRDQASGSKLINSLVNSKNGEALNDNEAITTNIGAIKKEKN